MLRPRGLGGTNGIDRRGTDVCRLEVSAQQDVDDSAERFSRDMIASMFPFGRRSFLLGSTVSLPFSRSSLEAKEKDREKPKRKMDPSLPRELLQAVYLATVEGRFMDEKAFEEKRFKIQRQEWPYYRQAYREELPEEEDYRIDEDGGIGYPLYYNFLSYVQWKAVAGDLNGRREKEEFIRHVGRYAWDSFKLGIDWQDANLRRALSNVLDAFVDGGYMADYEIVWDDIQVRLKDPADIIGSVALRAEEDGFWQRCISSVLGAFLEDRGFQSAVDEYIFQDKWTGPRTLGGRVLLLLGDPLQQVDVPFQPNAILQEWHTCKDGENAACDYEGWKSSGFFVYGNSS